MGGEGSKETNQGLPESQRYLQAEDRKDSSKLSHSLGVPEIMSDTEKSHIISPVLCTQTL